MLLRVTGSLRGNKFVAGAIVHNHKCIKTAPILYQIFFGRQIIFINTFCARSGWRLEKFSDANKKVII